MNESEITPDGKKAVVILLAGFLGSGKTTLLKQILSWETDLSGTVVMVNEFGDVGIDGSLLKDSGSDVVEMTSGCICCTLTADLKQSLERIHRRFNPDRVLIEASGVADPTSIATVISETGLKECMTLQKIITVLDADFWEARGSFGRLFYNQLEMANLILLNKIDLLDQDLIPRFLKEIHEEISDCQVIPTLYCRVDPETLWMDKKPKRIGIPSFGHFHATDESSSVDSSRYVTFSFQTTHRVNEECFRQFVMDLPFEMFRMKGPVRFEDRTVMINFVGGRCDWLSWEEEGETQLAFIGWDIQQDAVLPKLKSCLNPPNEPAQHV